MYTEYKINGNEIGANCVEEFIVRVVGRGNNRYEFVALERQITGDIYLWTGVGFKAETLNRETVVNAMNDNECYGCSDDCGTDPAAADEYLTEYGMTEFGSFKEA